MPQVPYDAQSLLVEKSAQIILIELGDMEGAAAKEKLIGRKEDSFVSLSSNRTKGENRKVINRYNLAWKYGVYWGY